MAAAAAATSKSAAAIPEADIHRRAVLGLEPRRAIPYACGAYNMNNRSPYA